MKTLMLILAVLMLVPAVWAADEGQFLDLTDGGKAAFKFSNDIRDNASIGISRMGGYFTVKYKKTGFGGGFYKAKSTKDVFNLNDWQSVSVDVRIPKQVAVDPLNVVAEFVPVQSGSVERWIFGVPRTTIPADGKWYRVVKPMSSLYKKPSGAPAMLEQTPTILQVVFAVWTDIEVSDTIETDLRNVRLWKTPVTEVQVIPLDK